MSDIEKNEYNWTGLPIVYAPTEESNNEDALTVADLFCGPGGISEGFKSAGFKSVLGADIHEPSVDTYRRNHPESYTILGNIKSINGQTHNDKPIADVIEEESYGQQSRLAKILEKIDTDVDVLTGGVPCQGFSLSNKKRDDEDERNYLFEEFIKATKIIQPKAILIENVSTMKSAKDGEFVDAIEKSLAKLGYNVEYTVLDASDYGVPQKRERLFFIGIQSNNSISWPKPTTSENSVTVEDAISDLATLSKGESGNTYRTNPNTEYQVEMRGDSTKYTNHKAPNHQSKTLERIQNTKQGEPMYERFKQRIRLDNSKPSPTIVSGGIRPQFQFGHPTQPRGLSVRERARIQSFPDSYEFSGGLTQSRVQTGMAVPPLLAAQLAKQIKKKL